MEIVERIKEFFAGLFGDAATEASNTAADTLIQAPQAAQEAIQGASEQVQGVQDQVQEAKDRLGGQQ